MDNTMTEKSLGAFAADLASKAPVPGGGGAAALAGALAAALGSMVCELTLGKKKYAQYEEELRTVAGAVSEAAALPDQRCRLPLPLLRSHVPAS